MSVSRATTTSTQVEFRADASSPDALISPDAQRVLTAVQACVGSDVPSPVVHVLSARTIGAETIATVVLFDGATSRLKVGTWGRFHAWTLQWMGDSASVIYWDGSQWMRDTVPDAMDTHETPTS